MAGIQGKQRVRFAPDEARLHSMIETLRSLLLLALFWPVLLPWRALMLGERLAASALGAYLGLLQVGSGLLQCCLPFWRARVAQEQSRKSKSAQSLQEGAPGGVGTAARPGARLLPPLHPLPQCASCLPAGRSLCSSGHRTHASQPRRRAAAAVGHRWGARLHRLAPPQRWPPASLRCLGAPANPCCPGLPLAADALRMTRDLSVSMPGTPPPEDAGTGTAACSAALPLFPRLSAMRDSAKSCNALVVSQCSAPLAAAVPFARPRLLTHSQ